MDLNNEKIYNNDNFRTRIYTMEESGRRPDLKDEIGNNVDIIKDKTIDSTSDCDSEKDSGWAWIIVFGM
jgi:hypothetical protein